MSSNEEAYVEFLPAPTTSDTVQEVEEKPSSFRLFETIPVVAVIGKTGSGKSSFIKTLGGRSIFTFQPPTISARSKSCTHTATAYTTTIQNRRIYLVDTPGFDDSARDNLAILNDITSHLWGLFVQKGFSKIQGVIFLHDISEVRMGLSQQKTWDIVKALCGEDGLKNVIVGTTMWSEGTPHKFENEEERETELQSHWKGIHKTMRVFYQNKEGAYQIIKEVLALPPAVLLVQKELMEPPHTAENTTAGRLAMPEGRELAKRLESEIQEATRQMQEAVRQDFGKLRQEHNQKKKELEDLQKKIKDAETERKSSSWCSIL